MRKLAIGLACLMGLTAWGQAVSKGGTMRSVNFRDNVLWAIAEKDGLDPSVDLLNDIAREYVSSINAWLRRLYDVADFAEWTDIQAFTADPTTHLISWDAVPSVLDSEGRLDPPKIGKVLKVYLLDPRTTWTPVDTPFRETKQGIYVGFEHGPTVWMKFIPRVPVFTSEVWDSSRTYRKYELTYSPAAGECYKSKVNSNRGNDPSLGVVNEQPIATEIVQQQIPDNPGLVERPETLMIGFTGVRPGPDPPTIPVVGSGFYVSLKDGAGLFLGDASHSANGSETITAIIAALATALDAAIPASFTVTPAALSMTIQDNSVFTTEQATYEGTGGPVSQLKVVQTQSYVPAVSAVSGVPQITQVSLTPADVVSGATYQIKFTDGDGIEHPAEYIALSSDSAVQILLGLIEAIEASTDVFFDEVITQLDTVGLKIAISTQQPASVDVTRRPPPGSYWTLIPFPFALADQVVRGVYADVLKTEGQADKGMAEEQSVPQETQLRISAGMATGTDMLTDQETARGRYAR